MRNKENLNAYVREEKPDICQICVREVHSKFNRMTVITK